MSGPSDNFESNYARLIELRELCRDPRTTLYVIAYLTAGFEAPQLDAAIRAAKEWLAADEPVADIVRIREDDTPQ